MVNAWYRDEGDASSRCYEEVEERSSRIPCRLFSKETFLERLGPVRGFVAVKPKPFKVRQKKSPSEYGYRPQTGDPEPYTLNPEP